MGKVTKKTIYSGYLEADVCNDCSRVKKVIIRGFPVFPSSCCSFCGGELKGVVGRYYHVRTTTINFFLFKREVDGPVSFLPKGESLDIKKKNLVV